MIEYRRLDEICNIIMGQSPDSKSYNYEGLGLPFFQGNADFGDMYPTKRVWCTLPTKVVEPNTLLISVRAPIGALNFSNEPSCIGRGLAGIVPKDSINLKYVYYCLRHKNTELNSKGTGSTFKAISKSALAEIKIKVVSKDRQAEIVTTLDNVTQIIKYRKQQLEQLDLLIKSRFVEMFGDIQNSKQYPYLPIKSFTNVISGGTPSRDITSYWRNGTIRWVKTTELQNSVIEDTEEKITQQGLENSSAKVVPAKTILIAMYGQGKTRGMTGYLAVEAATNQACACILPSKKFNSKYLWQYMIMSYNELRNLAKGGNQPNLNGMMIKNFCVLMPPIELQNEFVQFVDQVEKSKTQVQKSFDEAQLLFNSLMQEYFG